MQEFSDQKTESFKDKFLPLPLVLTMALFVVLCLGGVLFFIYAITLMVALNSAMVFLLILATSLLCEGLGILSLHGFFAYKKYYQNRISGFYDPPKSESKKVEQKTFKDYLTIQNVSLVILLIGAIFAIVSAALGCMNRAKWVNAVSEYMESHDYYADVEYREYRYIATESEEIKSIKIDLYNKNAVIIYTPDEQKQGFVTITGYDKYKNQIDVKLIGNQLIISEGERPSLDGTLEKMLFFMFDENRIEKQIKIYIPADLKDVISVEGECIIAR